MLGAREERCEEVVRCSGGWSAMSCVLRRVLVGGGAGLSVDQRRATDAGCALLVVAGRADSAAREERTTAGLECEMVVVAVAGTEVEGGMEDLGVLGVDVTGLVVCCWEVV